MFEIQCSTFYKGTHRENDWKEGDGFYIGVKTPGVVVKVRLSDFTGVGA